MSFTMKDIDSDLINMKNKKKERHLSDISTDTEILLDSPKKTTNVKVVRFSSSIEIIPVESYKKYNIDVSEQKKGMSLDEFMAKNEESNQKCTIF